LERSNNTAEQQVEREKKWVPKRLERARAHCLQNKTKEAKNQRRIKKGEHKTMCKQEE